MDGHDLRCPACRTPLRVRDPSLLRASIDCPECGHAIPPVEPPAPSEPPVETNPLKRVDADPILAAAPDAGSAEFNRLKELDATPRDESEPPPEVVPWWSSLVDRFRSPVVVAWSSAGLVAAVLLILFLSGPSDGTSTPPDDSAEARIPPGKVDPADPEDDDPNPTAEARERLENLGERLIAHRNRAGSLPADANVESGGLGTPLSWLARLEAADNLGGLDPPSWQHSFDDLRNAGFVRRERPAFLNPAVPTTRSPDRDPVTHFVGVAGVGADAPSLPPDHPRAGLFGLGRAASEADVVDGLSNTMMVAGVTSGLGSWAAAGPASLRPFTAEPYVNGPDGFGTGSPDGMLVLMADGSVRTVAANTDPRIVRRMAAMADGLDLALEKPGEPGDVTEPPDPPLVAEVDPPDRDPNVVDPPDPDPMPPVEPDDPDPDDPGDKLPLASLPELPKWSADVVAAKLAQPLGDFRTSRPVVAELLLDEVAEMCGVPVHARKEEGVDFAVFERSISLTVEKAKVGAVLEALLSKLDLRYVVADDGIHLVPVAPPMRDVPKPDAPQPEQP